MMIIDNCCGVNRGVAASLKRRKHFAINEEAKTVVSFGHHVKGTPEHPETGKNSPHRISFLFLFVSTFHQCESCG
jgi:hypothetical protein